MPIVYIVHGFVGSGKTTFARKLETETGAIRFTPDEWMIALYGDNPPAEMFGVYFKRIQDFIWLQIEKTIKAGADVILENVLWTRIDRDDAMAKIRSFGAEPRLYVLQTPFEICRERVLKRTEDMPDGALVIDDHAMTLFQSRFEPLQDDEIAIFI